MLMSENTFTDITPRIQDTDRSLLSAGIPTLRRLELDWADADDIIAIISNNPQIEYISCTGDKAYVDEHATVHITDNEWIVSSMKLMCDHDRLQKIKIQEIRQGANNVLISLYTTIEKDKIAFKYDRYKCLYRWELDEEREYCSLYALDDE